jgi:SAM-dependent methyltransferase
MVLIGGDVYMSNEQEIYSNQWKKSSDYSYNNGSYSWMCSKIKKYKIILEIGSGTGQGTLSLLETGHKVISIEKTIFVLMKQKLYYQVKDIK